MPEIVTLPLVFCKKILLGPRGARSTVMVVWYRYLHHENVEESGDLSAAGHGPALLDEVQANAAEIARHARPRHVP